MNRAYHPNALLAAPDQRGEPVANLNGMMTPQPRPPLRPDISYEALLRLLEAMHSRRGPTTAAPRSPAGGPL